MDRGVDEASSWRPGQVIDGRYEVLGVLGAGGMGVVHRVRHLEWGSDLAVKSPRFRRADARRRFVDEAEVWERLGLHPNVCGCHYVRMLDDVPMVFAEYVAGGSLAGRIADRSLYAGEPPEVAARVLDLAVQMAWGLEHAHARGVVHQDVKPANVLLEDSTDGVVTAKVTDFGLAKARAVASSLPGHDGPTAIAVSVDGMTMAYASPEQAEQAGVGRATDIYSFAVSLLEMYLGGVTWAVGPAAGEALAAHRAAPNHDPLLPELQEEMAALLERCLRDDPRRRPGSMADVAGELAEVYRQVAGRAYPQTRPVAADLRADELNNRGLSLLDLGRRDEAAEAFEAAIAADPRHLEATYNDGLRRWRSGAIPDDALVRRLEGASTAAGDSAAARHLLAEVHRERGADDDGTATAMGWHEYEGPGMPIMEIRFAADGRRALAVSGEHVGLWDVDDERCLVRLTGERDGPHVAVSADGRFALCGGRGQVRLWDLIRGRRLWRARTGAPSYAGINAVSLSADARVAATVLSTVVASSDKNNVIIWDARTGRALMRLGEHSGHIPAELSADGRYALTTGARDGTARLWDLDAGACVRELRWGDASDRGVSAIALSADVRTAAIARSDIGVWDLATGRLVRTLTGHNRLVRSLAWSADGRFLLSGGDDTIRLWETDTGRCLRTFPAGETGPWSGAVVTLEPDTGRVVAADSDQVRRWPLPRPYSAPPQPSRPRRHAELTRLDADATALVEEAERVITAGRYAEAHGLLTRARAIRGHERSPRALSAWRSLERVLPRAGMRASWQVREFPCYSYGAIDLSPDAAYAASGDYGTLRVWDTGTEECLREIDYPAGIGTVRLSDDGRRVLCANFGGRIGVWSIDTGERLMEINERRNDGSHWTYFTPDGRRALSDAYRTLRLWDLDSGRCAREITCEDGFTAVSLSPDGRRAVTAVGDETVRVWDLDTGECVRVLARDTGRIGSVAVSPDGTLALGNDDRTIRVWDLTSGAALHVLQDLPRRLLRARFIGDGRFVMSSGSTGAVRIWDPRTGRCLHTVETGQAEVRFALTPDGRSLLTSGEDARLRLWEFDWELGTSPS